MSRKNAQNARAPTLGKIDPKRLLIRKKFNHRLTGLTQMKMKMNPFVMNQVAQVVEF